MSTQEQQRSARSIRQLLDQKPNYGRDDPRFWREKIDRWERGKDRDRRQMDTQQRGEQPLTLKPTSFWQAPQSFWQGPQSFWQEPEPLKDALIAEIVKPLEAEIRHVVRSKLEALWAVKKVRQQQQNVGNIKWFFQKIQRQFEDKVIKLGDYLRILKAFYALLKLLDERRAKNKAKKDLEQKEWYEQQEEKKRQEKEKFTLGSSFSQERAWIAKEVSALAVFKAKGDEGLADQFLQETGMGSLDEIELMPGLKIKVKDDGGDDGGGPDDSGPDTTDDSSSSDSETKKKKDKPKTPQEEKSSRKWMALSAKLRAEATGLDKKEARRIMKEFGKAVAAGDENEARKSLSKAKNSTEIWKWAKGMFFKKSARGAIMSDPKEIMAMVKDLDEVAESLEASGADEALIETIDKQAAKLQAYYGMEETMYDDDEDIVDDSEELALDYQQAPPMQAPMQQPPMPRQPPMGGPMDPGCQQAPMLEDQTTIPNPGLPTPTLPDQTTLMNPRLPAPGIPGPTNSTMPVPQSSVPMEEDVALDDVVYDDDDDAYGDDEIMDYESDMVFADVVASVSSKLDERGATELAAEVRSLLNETE